ncbi:MAG: radical SAM protein [Actinobacteria bacterium]|nr:radical SAM protein [Actinomycetota bacterium]
MNSPEFIQTSLAAAISLGLEPGMFTDRVKLTGLNLLLTYDEGCIGKCAYCGISKTEYTDSNKHRNKKTFIRVKWPVYKLSDLLDVLKTKENDFERICLSMITHRNALQDTRFITGLIKDRIKLPISLLISPTLINKPSVLQEFKDSGAEMIGVAIDASTKEIFNKYRGSGVGGPHNWEKYWQVLKWSIDIFGSFKVGIHLIVGLGETEEEAVRIIYKAHKLGAKTHLFSFYPEACSKLVDLDPPALLSYRKIQIARYLINEENLDPANIRFDKDGRLAAFNYDLKEVLDEGHAFMTSGCPCSSNNKISACNRPFANERPSDTFRNYPFEPTDEDKEIIGNQIKILQAFHES